MAFTLYLNGEAQESTYVEPGESFRVQLEDVERSSGYPEACIHCGEAISDESDGWEHDDTGEARCEDDDNDAEPGPFAWCNSASVTLDPEDNAVHCSVSVGDPRGAFTFTVRQLDDGRIIIHTPHPGEGMAHMDTVEVRPGTLEVKGS